MSGTRALRHFGEGHLALVSEGQPRVDVDPRLPEGDDDRDAALGALRTDYLLLTRTDRRHLDDALDVLERGDATLIGESSTVEQAERALELDDRAVDVEAWEKVRFAGLTLTVLPAPAGDLLPDPGELLPGGLSGAADMASSMIERTMSALPGLGLGLRRHHLVGVLQPEGGPAVLLAGDALVGAAPRRWLDDVKEDVHVDVLVAAAAGDRVDGLVWAVRELHPTRVVLYRDRDPWDDGGRALPIQRFVEALAEDAPDVKVVVLRAGEELDLS